MCGQLGVHTNRVLHIGPVTFGTGLDGGSGIGTNVGSASGFGSIVSISDSGDSGDSLQLFYLYVCIADLMVRLVDALVVR